MAASLRLLGPLKSRVITSAVLTPCVRLGTQQQRTFVAKAPSLQKYYTEDHEWIDVSDDKKTGTIGITTYAAKSLGDVVYVELPQEEIEVKMGDAIGAVESVKSASDIMSPVSGFITEANSILEEKPGTINKGPEGEGWLAKIRLTEAAEVEKLMNADEYKQLTDDLS